jgi:hypothetical protein
MAAEGFDEAEPRHRRRRGKHKRKSRKHQRLMHNLRWFFGGLAVGLPLLAAVTYAASRY